jgi:hypothetical protein
MVIDAGELGFEVVLLAVLGVVAGSLIVGAIIATTCARLGRRPLGCVSLLMSWALAVGLGVVALVLWRAKNGEATLFDWLWAGGLVALSWFMFRSLWNRAAESAGPDRS